MRAAIERAYGRMLGRLEKRALVSLHQTQDAAIEAAAAARAKANGTSVDVERSMLAGSVSNSRSAMKSVDSNIARGRRALAKALDEKTTVHRAMFRNGLGWVDFEWGAIGRVKASGNTQGGMGLSHILEARARKDGTTDAQSIRLLDQIVQTIAQGEEISRVQVGDSINVVVEGSGATAVLLRNKGSNSWVLTGWEKKNPGEIGAGYDATDPTSNAPTHPRRDGVAGFEPIIDQGPIQIKRSEDGHIQGFHDPATGQSFLIADHLTEGTAPGVLLHEIGIHAANDGTFDPMYRRADMMLRAGRGNPFFDGVREKMAQAGETSAEEAAAYLVEAYERDRIKAPRSVARWVRDFIATVRAWLNKRGVLVGVNDLTAADIAAMARSNARALAAGRAVAGKSGGATRSSVADKPLRPASNFREARVAAGEFQGKPLTNKATGMVATVSRNSLDKMLSRSAADKSASAAAHASAVANLDSLFSRAVLGWSKPERSGDRNIVAIHRFFVPMRNGGRDLMAKMTVKETAIENDPNPLYTVETVDFNEESPAAMWVAASADTDGIDLTSIRSAGEVLSLAEQVERGNVRSSKTPGANADTAGDQTGTPAFKKWFGASKVVDDAGRPPVVYHGTTGDFSEFRLAASSQPHNQGFFFTSSPYVASQYAGADAGGANVQGITDAIDKMDRKGIDSLYADLRAARVRVDWFGYMDGETLEENRTAVRELPFDPMDDDDQSVLLAMARSLGVSPYQAAANASVMPVFLALKNPLVVDARREEFDDERQAGWIKEAIAGGHDGLIIKNHDDGGTFREGEHKSWGKHNVYIAFESTQVKSATGNNGDFGGNNPDIRFSRAAPAGTSATPSGWSVPESGRIDNLIYNLQDGRVDLKRVQESITAATGALTDQFDARQAETLYMGRVAKRSADFLKLEAAPMLESMARNSVGMDELSDYMLARHAPERNAQIAKVNPKLQDGGAGSNSAGVLMTDAAAAHLAGLPAARRELLKLMALPQSQEPWSIKTAARL